MSSSVPLFIYGIRPQEFFYELCKIVKSIGVTAREKAEIACYQLKNVAETWFSQLKDNRKV